MNTKTVLGIVVTVIVVGGGIYFYSQKDIVPTITDSASGVSSDGALAKASASGEVQAYMKQLQAQGKKPFLVVDKTLISDTPTSEKYWQIEVCEGSTQSPRCSMFFHVYASTGEVVNPATP